MIRLGLDLDPETARRYAILAALKAAVGGRG